MKLSSKELKPLFMESVNRLNKAFVCIFDPSKPPDYPPDYDQEERAAAEDYQLILSDAFEKSKDLEGCANLCTMIAAMCFYSSYRTHAEYQHNFYFQSEAAELNRKKIRTYCIETICCADEAATEFYTKMFELIQNIVNFEESEKKTKSHFLSSQLDVNYETRYAEIVTHRKIIHSSDDLIGNTNATFYCLSEYIEGWYKLYNSPYAKQNHLEVPAYFLHLYNVTAYNDFLIALTDNTRTFSSDEISKIETEIIDNLSPELTMLDGCFDDNSIKQILVTKQSHTVASALYISLNKETGQLSEGALYHLLPHTMYNYFSLNHSRTAQYQLKIAKLEKELDGIEKKRARGEITEKEAQDEMIDKIKHIQSELSKKSIPEEIENYFNKMLSIENLSEETKQDIKLTKELMGSIGIGVDIFMLPLFRSLERELNKKIFDKIRENLSKAHIKAQCKDKYIRNLFPCSNPTIMLGFHFKDILKPNKYYNKKYTKEERNQCKADLRLIHNKIDNADHGLENFKKIVNISRNNFACVDMYLSRIRNAICHRIDDDIEKIRGAEENLAKEILICFSETYEVFKAICEIENNLT